MTTQIESDTVIKLENLSKRFELVAESPNSVFDLLRSRLPGSTKTLAPKKQQNFWAVKDVNLEVKAGQCLGIIGKNGSGKSTMLKLISRILLPTKGRIMVKGRLSALLELGTGFHQDLTGRENIYLNAAILGLSRSEIDAHFDSVIAFSELEQFIDTPVKYYSSGMYMRLGFSIAIHVNPQILIVDEILAVGDQAFQEKCINHIFEMKRQGTTIVVVSHNLDVLRKLCTHLAWMDQGHLRAYGAVEELIQEYLSFLQSSGMLVSRGHQAVVERAGTGEVEITAVRFLNGRGEESDHFLTGEAMTIEMHYTAHKPIHKPEFGIAIHREDGVQVNGPNTQTGNIPIDVVDGPGIVRYHIPKLPLLPARYFVTTAVHDSAFPKPYDHHDKAYMFQVLAGGTRELFGLVEIDATWEWEPQNIQKIAS
jgi:ABC-type polysaccharide/polyol phosphate transport system ATPase subunit